MKTTEGQNKSGAPFAEAGGYAPWTPPFSYNRDGQWIEDSRGNRLMDVRGWGFLTGRGNGLAMDEEAAAKIQDAMGERVTTLINADVEAYTSDSATSVA